MLRRPAEAAHDADLAFAAVAEGQYRAELTLPSLGQWDAAVVATAADGTHYRLEQRLWLK
jgi:nitrogen fixation protein FixH